MDTKHTRLHNEVFDIDSRSYAVIDGATAPMLLGKLDEVNHACLLRGELSLDLAEAAPYLVELKKDDDFTHWLLEFSQKQACCIFMKSKENIFSVRKHCRSLLKAQLPDGDIVFFRFYDPRVLKIYAESTNIEDRRAFLGGVLTTVIVAIKGDKYLSINDEGNPAKAY